MANPDDVDMMESEEESDEESDEDDEDDDAMDSGSDDEDAMESAAPTSSTVSQKKKMRDASDQFNLQVNQRKKSVVKKQKKADKKRKRGSLPDDVEAPQDAESSSDDEGDANEERYDFGADFWSKVDVRQIVEDDAPVPKKKQKRADTKTAAKNVNDFNV
jgi:hypothetical protein